MSPERRGDEETRRALAEWVAYLRDIGVRDLRAAPRSPAPDRPAPPPAPPRTPPPRETHGRASAPELFSLADSASEGASDPVARLRAIREDLGDCRRCRLHERRTHLVFGVGNPSAGLMFVGEGPGAEEDARGEPFVGQAGRLLDNMLAALGVARGRNVYIANVLKCRPPNNRTPEPAEADACRPYLERQVALLRPKLIVALGKSAASLLLTTDATIASLRGRVHRYRGVPLVVTYHPAYLLRNLPDKAKAWEDLLLARRTAAQSARPDPAEPPSVP